MSEKMKITLISFDNWNYDKEIVTALKKKNIDANHIDLGKYKHRNLFERLKNAFFKIVLNKNLKFQKRQEFILETLTKLGTQDYILVLNPDLIDSNSHQEIKKHTKRYISYLYDSIARSKYPIGHLLEGIFDEIFSFDTADVQKYNFKKINNYIYLDKNTEKPALDYKYKVTTVSSFDKRFPLFNALANQLSEQNISFNFIFVSRNIIYKLLKYKQKNNDKVNATLKFRSTKVSLEKTNDLYKNSLIILDLVQGNQTGLSFRVFEAMAMQKKIITDNQSIMNYDFYNPKNIMVISKDNFKVNSNFFTEPYQPISDDIYNKYTIKTWVENIFNI